MTTTKTPTTREAIETTAADNGWELISDQGFRIEFRRGLETLRVYFSSDDAGRGRRITGVFNNYPTGDRRAASGDPVFAIRGGDNRSLANKRQVALAYLTEAPHRAKPGHNALLAKMGFEPVLAEAEEV